MSGGPTPPPQCTPPDPGARFAAFPPPPHLLRWPLPSQRAGHVLAVEGVVDRIIGREDLDHVQDLEAGAPEDAEEIAVAEMELDRRLIVGPFEPVQSTLRPLQALLDSAGVGHAEHREGRVAQEHELATGPKEACRFWDPLVRVAPDRRAVLGYREIERCVAKAGRFGVRLDQLETETEILGEPPRYAELCRSEFDAHHAPRAAALQPGGDVRRAAAQLDDVLPSDVREDVHFRFGRIPEAPADLRLGPGMLGAGIGIPRVVLGPVRPVDAEVVGFGGAHARAGATSA